MSQEYAIDSSSVPPDNFRHNRRMSGAYYFAPPLIGGFVLGNVLETNRGDGHGLAVMAATSLGLAGAGFRAARRREKRTIESHIQVLEKLRDVTGEVLEVVALPKRGRVMVWSGSVDDGDIAKTYIDRLLAVKTMASSLDCQHIAVQHNILPGDDIRELGEQMTIPDIVREASKLKVTDRDNRRFSMFSQAEFLASTIHQPEKLAGNDVRSIQAYVAVLRQIQPQHPVVRTFDEHFEHNPAFALQEIRANARSALGMHLSTSEVHRNAETGQKEKVHEYGLLTGRGSDTRLVFVDDHGNIKPPIMIGKHFGLSDDMLDRLGNIVHIPPEKYREVRIACEVALATFREAPVSDEPEYEYKPHFATHTIYEELMHPRRSMKQRQAHGIDYRAYQTRRSVFIHLGLALSLYAAGFIAGGLETIHHRTELEYRVDAALEKALQQTGYRERDFDEVVENAISSSGYLQVRYDVDQAILTYESAMKELTSGSIGNALDELYRDAASDIASGAGYGSLEAVYQPGNGINYLTGSGEIGDSEL